MRLKSGVRVKYIGPWKKLKNKWLTVNFDLGEMVECSFNGWIFSLNKANLELKIN